jgi:hypothetical protein
MERLRAEDRLLSIMVMQRIMQPLRQMLQQQQASIQLQLVMVMNPLEMHQ